MADQWLIATLRRFRECSFRRLEAELQAIAGVTPRQVVDSILKLELAGVIERAPTQGLVAEERSFRLTSTGRRIGGVLPREPRSPTLFYV